LEKKKFNNLSLPLFIFVIFIFSLSYFPSGTKTKTDNSFTIAFLNVGQGDAIAFKGQKQLTLVDGGPDKSLLAELAKLDLGLNKRIDNLFLTHPHADHLVGLNYLFDSYKIVRVFTTGVSHNSPDYLEFLRNIKAQNISTTKTVAGQKYLIEGASVKILWPRANSKFKDLNDTSLVILVTYGDVKTLLLGDLSAEKQDIIADSTELPDIDIIKIAHHGSKTGLSEKILAETKPEIAIITVGKNYYGHPSPDAIKGLKSLKVLRTDHEGTIIFSTDGKKLFRVD
jgi:competence protein ComEC